MKSSTTGQGEDKLEETNKTSLATSEEGPKHPFYCLLVLGVFITYISTQFSDIGFLTSIQDQVVEYFNINDFAYTVLNAIFAFVVAVFALFGGLIIDKFGILRCFAVFISCITVGYALSLLSGITKSYALLALSRFAMGLGTEALQNTINVSVGLYFSGNNLHKVFALLPLAAALGAIGALIVTLQMYKAVSMTFALIYPYFILLVATVFLVIFFSKPYQTKNNIRTVSGVTIEELVDKFKFENYKEFPILFWIYLIANGIIGGASLGWFGVSVSFLSSAYNVSNETATLMIGSPILLYMGLLFGGAWLMDKYGKRGHANVIAAICMFLAIFILTFLQSSPVYAVIGLCLFTASGGIQYSYLNASVTRIIENENIRGTAFGLMSSSRYTLAGVLSLGVGGLTKSGKVNGKYDNAMYFLCVISLIGVIISIITLQYDKKHGQRLLLPANKFDEDGKIKNVDHDSNYNENGKTNNDLKFQRVDTTDATRETSPDSNGGQNESVEP